MRQATVVGLALVLAGCATTQPVPSATPTTAQSRSAAATPAPELCIVDGRESSCDDVAKIPKDRVETVEVLKGTAATTLYGSRAAAGVIVVTTKH